MSSEKTNFKVEWYIPLFKRSCANFVYEQVFKK